MKIPKKIKRIITEIIIDEVIYRIKKIFKRKEKK